MCIRSHSHAHTHNPDRLSGRSRAILPPVPIAPVVCVSEAFKSLLPLLDNALVTALIDTADRDKGCLLSDRREECVGLSLDLFPGSSFYSQ